MLRRISDIWYEVTYFGVREDMPYALQKRTILCNKLSLLVVALAVLSAYFFFIFQIKGHYTSGFLLLIAASLAIIPHLNRINQITFTRLALSLSAPYVILIYTLISKVRYPLEVEPLDYFAPRTLIFLTILLPLVLLDFKKVWQMVIGLSGNVICLLFFDRWHIMFDVGYENLINAPSYSYDMINSIYFIATAVIVMAFYFYQRTNDHFEMENQKLLDKVRRSNYDLKREKRKLQEAYRQLKLIDDEIRQNSEELKSVNEYLVRTRDELITSYDREREINEQLNKAHEELKLVQMQMVHSEKMASLGQLTAGVAHEINNPINFVYAGVSTLQSTLQSFYEIVDKYERLDPDTNPEEYKAMLKDIADLKEDLEFGEMRQDIDEIVNAIHEGATRTAEIVKGLRNFSRLDEEQLKMANINESLESTLVILSGQFKDHIEVVKQYEENLPSIHCYPGQLNQVFLNLLNNSRQAIEGKGKIYISTYSNKKSVFIKIGDTGTGIAPEVLVRIFEPFYTTKEVGEGTGLGLSISYGIIEKHNGRINVQSKLGEGTEFVIELPRNLGS